MSRTWAAVSVTAAVSVCVTLAWVSWRDSQKVEKTVVKRKSAAKAEVSPEIIEEQLARNKAFLGEEGVKTIREKFIVVVGAGGVGSWVATMLVRSGIGKIRIIDFDQVTLSSLNRHACATLADVGTSKPTCLAEYLNKVAPWVEIDPVIALWTKERTDLLDGADYVVDCIDNIETKVDLLAYCHNNNIPVVASMGAGTKADPTRVQIADISQTSEDPLSKTTRIKLRHRGIKCGITAVFSTEKPGQAKLLDLDESQVEEGNVGELSVLRDFRVRILPVLGPLPAIFGLTIATHLLTLIGGYPGVYDPIEAGLPVAGKARRNLYEQARRSLNAQFVRLKWPEAEQSVVTEQDIEYLIEEVWRGKSITGQTNRLQLSIWDPSKPRDIHNVVPVNKEQQLRHEEEIIKNGKAFEELYPPQVIELVAKRQALDQWFETMR